VFEIRRGLQRVLLDPVLRARMKQRGYEQAQRFFVDQFGVENP